MSRSHSDRQPPRHRRSDPDDRDDQHRALTVANASNGVADVELALTGHDIDMETSGYLAADAAEDATWCESLCGCHCPDDLCYHLGPVFGDGWQVTA